MIVQYVLFFWGFIILAVVAIMIIKQYRILKHQRVDNDEKVRKINHLLFRVDELTSATQREIDAAQFELNLLLRQRKK